MTTYSGTCGAVRDSWMMDGWYFGWVTVAAPDRSVVWFGWFGLVFGVWLGLAWLGGGRGVDWIGFGLAC